MPFPHARANMEAHLTPRRFGVMPRASVSLVRIASPSRSNAASPRRNGRRSRAAVWDSRGTRIGISGALLSLSLPQEYLLPVCARPVCDLDADGPLMAASEAKTTDPPSPPARPPFRAGLGRPPSTTPTRAPLRRPTPRSNSRKRTNSTMPRLPVTWTSS